MTQKHRTYVTIDFDLYVACKKAEINVSKFLNDALWRHFDLEYIDYKIAVLKQQIASLEDSRDAAEKIDNAKDQLYKLWRAYKENEHEWSVKRVEKWLPLVKRNVEFECLNIIPNNTLCNYIKNREFIDYRTSENA